MEKAGIKIRTRGSKLALSQSSKIGDIIMNEHPGIDIETGIITSKGDKVIDSPLSRIRI